MRTFFLRLTGVLLFILLGSTSLHGQVKIGTNPETINLSSLLELESTSKVLVISRVSTAQMNAIKPLEGAMVYNTDAQCLHYYNGVEWINICEAFGNALTFTSNSVLNSGNFQTIKITQTDNNYNFEVGLLNASNIQDGTIGTPKIVTGAITQTKLADNSVNSSKIADKSIQTIDIAPGLANTVLQTNNTGSNVIWAPLDASVVTGRDLTAGDASIIITNGALAILKDADVRVADGGITTAKLDADAVDNTKLADNAVQTENIVDATITDADLADNAVTSAKILNETILSEDIADETITSADILNGTILAEDIADDAITAAKIVDNAVTLTKLANGTAAGQLMQWDGTDWVLVDDSALTITETDGIIGNEVTDATDGTLTLSGTGVVGDEFTLGVSPLGITDTEIADNAVTLPKLADGNAAGQLMQWDGTDWVLIDDSALAITETDGIIGNEISDVADATLIRTGLGTTADPYLLGVNTSGISDNEIADNAVTLPKLADGNAAGQLMQWDGTDWVLIDDSALTITEIDGIIGNEVTDATDGTLTLSGTGVVGDEFTLGVSPLGITDTEIADNAVTLTKLANGTAAGQLMQWDGTDWVLVDDSALTITETDGIIGNEVTDATDGTLTLSGTGVVGDEFTLGVSPLGITDTEIADNAVTLTKLANGTAAGQLMQWDGTDWVLVDDSALTITETDGIIGNEVTDATDGTLTLSGTGVVGDEFTLGVSPLGITDTEIANNAINSAKIADDAVTTAKIGTAGTTDAFKVLGTDLLGDPLWLNLVSTDAGNTILTGSDGGVYYDDSTAKTAISAKEDSANKSSDITLADATNTKFPTELAVKTYVDNATSDIATNTTSIATKEDTANKSSDITLADATNTNFPTELAVKTYVDNQITASNTLADGTFFIGNGSGTAQSQTISGDATITNTGALTIADNAVNTDKIGTTGVTDANKALRTDAAGNPSWESVPVISAIGMVNRNADLASVTQPMKIKGATVVRLSTGVYEITFDTPRPDALYNIQLSVLGTGGTYIRVRASSTANIPNVNRFFVETFNLSGAAADSAFHFTVTDF